MFTESLRLRQRAHASTRRRTFVRLCIVVEYELEASVPQRRGFHCAVERRKRRRRFIMLVFVVQGQDASST